MGCAGPLGGALFSDALTFDLKKDIPTEGSDCVFGENTDGMELYHQRGTELLVVNSEYVNGKINLPAEQDGQPVLAEDGTRLQKIMFVQK